MARENNPAEETGKGDVNPLPVAEPVPVERPIEAVTSPQGKLPAHPAQQQPQAEFASIPQPLLIQTVEVKEPSTFERRTILLGWLGLSIAFLSFVAAIFAGFLIYNQWWEMNAQTGYMNRAAIQARKDSADSNVTTANQLRILQEQLTQQRNAMILDQKAWVGVTVLNTAPDLYGSIQQSATIVNTGRGPANQVRSVVANCLWIRGFHIPTLADGKWMGRIIEAYKSGKLRGVGQILARPTVNSHSDRAFLVDPSLVPTGLDVWQNSIQEVGVSALAPNVPFPFAWPGGYKYASGVTVVVFGEITYRDVFGATRRTIFCDYTADFNTQHFGACPVFNDMK